MLKSAIALIALFFMSAIASPAVAQNPNCINTPLGQMMPAGCTQADADARRQAIKNSFRASAEETQIYRDYQQEQDYLRRPYRVPADEIRFGVHQGPMGTLYGRPMGRAGQCDRNGCYGSGSYAYDGYDYDYYGYGWYHRRGVYIYPYAEPGVDMHVPPQPPKDVYVSGGRGWKCRHLERAWKCQVGSTKGETAFAVTAVGAVAIYLLTR